MKYLLDTHVILWFFSDTNKLSRAAIKAILEPTNNKFVSVISAWELAIKISLGKLKFEGGVTNFIHILDENGFSLISVEKKHVHLLETLPFHHRDPFDRMLIATAAYENLYLITSDTNIHHYNNVTCIW